MQENKRRRGRPTQEVTKRNTLTVRLTDEELHLLDVMCDQYDVTYSGLIRMWLKLEAARMRYFNVI